MRETIDVGIDLGTTNSAVAVAVGTVAEIVRNAQGEEFTPSALYISRAGSVRVGRAGADRVELDPGNACAEFKLRMGRRDQDKLFEASGRTLTPEEMSAQVLMALRGNLELRGEAVPTAVITVPAAFTSDQTAATMKAAELAGLRSTILLQEPTAAAWAYMAETRDRPDKGFWLVYDFGGGTFDAAVVRFEDGEFTAVNHAGDNTLGGKRIDWVLVEDVLLPALHQAYGSDGISRDDPRTRGAVARLKRLAETAKIELAVRQEVLLEEDVVVDGTTVELTRTVTRDDLERAARPLVEASVRHCRQALAGAGLSTRDVDRVVLVGGSSQLALVREMLADPVEGLGIRVDHSQDPITVVARGAAIYAGTKPVPEEIRRDRQVDAGTVRLNLSYSPVGLDEDPLLGGQAESEGTPDWSGWTIELRNSTTNPEWSSGQVPLDDDGVFRVRLHAPETTRHIFEITLRDAVGAVIPTDRATITYDHRSQGVGDAAARQSHTLSVALVDNTVEVLVPKNVELPRTGRARRLRTSMAISKSAGTGRITVPVLQGEHERADRNTVVGRLVLRPEDVDRDVPAGTELEVEVTIDESFQITASVFVPYLDEEFTIQVDPTRPLLPGIEELRERRSALHDRLEGLRERAREAGAVEATARLGRFEAEGGLTEIDRTLDQAAVDQDAIATCEARLLEADSALDEVEELLSLPEVTDAARQAVAIAQEVVTHYGARDLEDELAKVRSELEEAIADGDRVVIERRTQEALSIAQRGMPEEHMVLSRFQFLEEVLADDPSPEARRLLADGRAARAAGDLRRLDGVVTRLRRFVPSGTAEPSAPLPGGQAGLPTRGNR